MARKMLIISSILVSLILILIMVRSIVANLEERNEIQSKISSIPVTINLFKLDSTRFDFPTAKPIILVLFNSTCEHCQYELSQTKKNITNFDGIELVFLSAEPIAVIKQVATAFASADNVNFIKIKPEDVYENFGIVRFPTILIYNTQGKLVKEFKGETKIEAILQYARQ
jgi:thioredoxin-related protein